MKFILTAVFALAAASSAYPTYSSLDKRTNFGSCSAPDVIFAAGLGGRKEDSFQAANLRDFNQVSALDINIITDFICQHLQSPCKAPESTINACELAKAATAGKTGQAAADAFNSALHGLPKRSLYDGDDGEGKDNSRKHGNGRGRDNGKGKAPGNGRGRNRGNGRNKGKGGNNGNNGNHHNNIDDNNGGTAGNDTLIDNGAYNNGTVAEDPAADNGATDDAADEDAADCAEDGTTDNGNNNNDNNNDNGKNNGGNNGKTGDAGHKALDLGICKDPTMSRAAGRPGRKADEFTFFPTNSDGNFGGQQDALNPAIIANFICDTFANRCKASQEALATCRKAQAAVVEANAAGQRDQAVADSFNAALGF